jgi:hypothetical protein
MTASRPSVKIDYDQSVVTFRSQSAVATIRFDPGMPARLFTRSLDGWISADGTRVKMSNDDRLEVINRMMRELRDAMGELIEVDESSMPHGLAHDFTIDFDVDGQTITYTEPNRKIVAACSFSSGLRLNAASICEWVSATGLRSPVTPDEKAEIIRRISHRVTEPGAGTHLTVE